MLNINVQDLENIFKNVRIKFNQEYKHSDLTYLEILLNELQYYFNNLNVFKFDSSIFITQDKILTLDKYKKALTLISDNIATIYKKTDEIIKEVNKLVNYNIYERETITKKLDKIQNFVTSSVISSEQNAEYSIYFRENFNDSSMEDKIAGSKGIEVDSFASCLKLKSSQGNDKKSINLENVSISFVNKDKFTGNIFPSFNLGQKLSASDMYDIHNGEYFGKQVPDSSIRKFMQDDDIESNITSTPFEICYTNPIDLLDIKNKIKKSEPNIEKLELYKEGFIPEFMNSNYLEKQNPELLLNINLEVPITCNYFDIKFDYDMPHLVMDQGFIKGKVYDNSRSYNIINMNDKTANTNFPTYRIFWGKLINLTRIELAFLTKWKDVSLKLEKWEMGYNFNNSNEIINIKKALFVEKFDQQVYNNITGNSLSSSSLVQKVFNLVKLDHGAA